MSAERDSEARSCNRCCSEKAVSITFSECMFVALGMQHAMRMRHIVICGLPRSIKFFHFVSQFSGGGGLFNIKCGFRFSLQFLSEFFFHSKKNWARYNKCT